MALLLPLLAVFIPLLITPGVLFHYDTAPAVIFLVLAMAAFVLRPSRLAQAGLTLWQSQPGRALVVVGSAQIFWFAVASVMSTRPAFSFFGSGWRRLGFLTILALMLFAVFAASQLSNHREQIRRLLRVMSVVAIAGAVYGILQYFDLDPFQYFDAYHAKDGDATIVRPPGTLGHADYFAWWLAISLFCSLAQANSDTSRWRITGRVSAFVCGAAILLSGTRSGMLAVIAGFFALAALTGLKAWKRHATVFAILLVLVAAFYRSPGGERLRARAQWWSDESLGGGRPLLWRDSLRMALSHPLTGFGPETFAAEFPRYQSVELARQLPDFYHESPHNMALDALISEGIPGVLVFLGWGAVAGYAAISALRKASPPAPALIAALVASAICSVFNVTTTGPAFATLLTVAILISEAADPVAAGEVSRAPAIFRLSPAVALALSVFAVLLLNYEFRLERFEQIAGTNAGPAAAASYAAVARARLPGAADDAYCARKLLVGCAKTPLMLERIECLQVATQAAAHATSTSDNPPNAWYNLAMFTATLNDTINTERSLRSAENLAPNWFKPHWVLASVLAGDGKESEASVEAGKAVLLNGGKNPEVADSLRKVTRLR